MNTVNQTPRHPANEELAAFALGKEVPNAETIAEHIAKCARCETLVAKTPRDTFLGILNNAKPGESFTGPHVPNTDSPTADELPEGLRAQKKYTFLKKLGGGGMGVVYLAEHNLMKRKVAVKLIPPQLIGNPVVRERFLQEVVSAAALEHPNVVRAYSAEEFGAHMLFEMEFVDGKDLGEVVKRKGPLPVVYAVSYIRQAAQALQHGMLKSLVHRDIKPGNLMLTRAGSVKVADFGLAKFGRESERGRDRSLTGTNAMMGTPDYMAPEQARNAKIADIRADIYSLGGTFYYLLTGQPPFAGESIADLIIKHWEAPRPDVGSLRNDVPPELSRFIQNMMAKEPGDRPQTPKEVVDWLTKFATGEPATKEAGEKPKVKSSVEVKKESTDYLNFQELPPEPATWQTHINPKGMRRHKKWPMVGGAIACLLVTVALARWLTSVMLQVETPNGTLVVEMADKDVEAQMKNGKLIISGLDGVVRYTLTPSKHDNKIEAGAYKIHVEGTDGLTLDTPEFTLKAGDKVTVRVTAAPTAIVKSQPKKQGPIADPQPQPTILPAEPLVMKEPKIQEPAKEPAPLPVDPRDSVAQTPENRAGLWALNQAWFRRYKTMPRGLSFSADGKKLVAIVAPELAYVLEGKTGGLLDHINDSDMQSGANVAGPNDLLVVRRHDDLFIWDLRKKIKVSTLAKNSHATPYILTKRHDGAVFIADAYGGIEAISLTTGKVVESLKSGLKYAVTRLDCSEDEKTILVMNSVAELLVKTAIDREFRSITQPDATCRDASLSQDGKLAALCVKGGPIRIVQSESGKEIRKLDGAGEALAAKFAKDSNHLVSVGVDNVVRVWDLETGKQLQSAVSNCNQTFALAISMDGNWVAVSGPEAIQMFQIGASAQGPAKDGNLLSPNNKGPAPDVPAAPVENHDAVLDAARKKYQADLAAVTKEIQKLFEKREDAARQRGDKPEVDRIKIQKQLFNESNEMPPWLPRVVSARLMATRAKFAAALKRAQDTHLRNKQDALATARESELRAFNLDRASLSARMDKLPGLFVDGNPWLLVGDEIVSNPQLGKPGAVFFGDPSWAEYDLAFTVKLSSDKGHVGARFHASDTKTFRALEFGGYGNQAKDLYNVINGQWKARAGGGFVRPGIQLDRWYELKIQVRREKAIVVFDGKKIIDGSNDNFTFGRLGFFFSGKAEARIRDVEVKTPDGLWLWRGVSRLGIVGSLPPK